MNLRSASSPPLGSSQCLFYAEKRSPEKVEFDGSGGGGLSESVRRGDAASPKDILSPLDGMERDIEAYSTPPLVDLLVADLRAGAPVQVSPNEEEPIVIPEYSDSQESCSSNEIDVGTGLEVEEVRRGEESAIALWAAQAALSSLRETHFMLDDILSRSTLSSTLPLYRYKSVVSMCGYIRRGRALIFLYNLTRSNWEQRRSKILGAPYFKELAKRKSEKSIANKFISISHYCNKHLKIRPPAMEAVDKTIFRTLDCWPKSMDEKSCYCALLHALDFPQGIPLGSMVCDSLLLDIRRALDHSE